MPIAANDPGSNLKVTVTDLPDGRAHVAFEIVFDRETAAILADPATAEMVLTLAARAGLVLERRAKAEAPPPTPKS